jgi:DUF4097 and DUF4098 domain-containing protein YvlB
MLAAKKVSEIAITVGIMLSTVLASASGYQGSFQRNLQVSGPVRLEIDAGSSDITIHGGPAGQVSVSGKIHVSNGWLFGRRTGRVEEVEQNPPIRQNGNVIRIEDTHLNNISVDYEITVPANTPVQSHLGSGDLSIRDLNADLDLASGSGDLVLQHITGTIRSHSGSGDVRAEDVNGPLNAEASSGDIRVEERGKGDIELHTTSGNVEVRGVDGALRIEAGSGDITAEGRPSGNWEARAGSGNIHLSLPRDAGFQLDAKTSSGEWRIDHAVTMTVQGNLDSAQHAVKGTVGNGGPTITVHTGSGDVDID